MYASPARKYTKQADVVLRQVMSLDHDVHHADDAKKHASTQVQFASNSTSLLTTTSGARLRHNRLPRTVPLGRSLLPSVQAHFPAFYLPVSTVLVILLQIRVLPPHFRRLSTKLAHTVRRQKL